VARSKKSQAAPRRPKRRARPARAARPPQPPPEPLRIAHPILEPRPAPVALAAHALSGRPPQPQPQTGIHGAPATAHTLRPTGALPENPGRPRPARDRRDLVALVLAAGLGKRMQSKWSKLLHPLAGRPMVRHVVEVTKRVGVSRAVVVVGNQAEEVRQAVGDHDKKIAFAYQKEQLGTGHAVLCAEKLMDGHAGDVLILNGDLPALKPETLHAFVAFHRAHGAPLTLLTTVIPDPRGYGRVIRNYGGEVARVVEEVDATPDERATQEINCGIYCVDAAALFRPLRRATRDNAQGEIYLTDLVSILHHDGRPVAAYRHPEAHEVLGVNDRRAPPRPARAGR